MWTLVEGGDCKNVVYLPWTLTNFSIYLFQLVKMYQIESDEQTPENDRNAPESDDQEWNVKKFE